MSVNGSTPDPYDLSTNAGLLIPPLVYMELKCKVPDPRAVTSGRHAIVVFTRVPFKVVYEPDRYVFLPLAVPEPPWLVIPGFIVGSYVLEAYTPAGESLIMWDLGGQEDYRPGDLITPDMCSMPRS